MSVSKSPYDVLGVSWDADEDEIKKKYRALVRQYHPDIHPGDEEAARKMSEINAAYEQIKSGEARGYYNTDTYRENLHFYSEVKNLLKNGEFSRAAALLDGHDEHDAEWYYYSAKAYIGLGIYKYAADCADNAAKLEPDNKDYVNLSVRINQFLIIEDTEEQRKEINLFSKQTTSRIVIIFTVIFVIQLIVGMFSFRGR